MPVVPLDFQPQKDCVPGHAPVVAPEPATGETANVSFRKSGRVAELPSDLTVLEVAEIMRVSKMTVYRLLHSGELPGVRVGRSFRVPQDALDHYLSTSLPIEAPGADEGRKSS